MLPTKGFFQDIECPYLNSGCGRPYCHFRHKKKINEDDFNDKISVPIYKPTPKSELVNFHNKNHIPISYVPDLAFRKNNSTRSLPRFNKPTYKPTPISILSSALQRSDFNELGECKTVKEIKQNIAKNEYNPNISLKNSNINFEELIGEFNLIDEIIRHDDSKKDNQIINSTTAINDLNDIQHSTECTKDYPFKDDLVDTSVVKKFVSENSECSEKCSDNKVNVTIKSDDNKDIHKCSDKNKKEKSKHKNSNKDKCSDGKHKSDSKSKEKSKNKNKASIEQKSGSRSHKSSSHKKDKASSSKHKKHSSILTAKDKFKKTEDVKKIKEMGEFKYKQSEMKKDNENIQHNKVSISTKLLENKILKQYKKYDVQENDDFDYDNDKTLLECYKIFNEYKPETKVLSSTIDLKMEKPLDILTSKKRVAHSITNNSFMQSKLPPIAKPKTILSPGQTLHERFKIAQASCSNKEQENIANEVKQPLLGKKRQASLLLEAASKRKITKPTENCNLNVGIIDSKSTCLGQKIKKIAPVQNLLNYQKAKEQLGKLVKQNSINVKNKTVAQTQKSRRTAHIPEFSLSSIPDVLHANNSKLPVNVRTRFLTMLGNECGKLYLTKDDAYQRALNEEFSCYEKCKVLVTYRNSAMLAVNRLRKEIQEREKSGLGPIDSKDLQLINTKSDFCGQKFYDHVKKWILSDEELDIHGYPRESETSGKAIIRNKKNILEHLKENQRKCCRCNKIYFVDDDGWPLYDEECLYHPLKKRTIRGEHTYLCCKATDIGCVTSDTHVSESIQNSELEGFMTTLKPEKDNDQKNFTVYALDCEMCYTTKGLELTRVTIIDTECRTVYESLVKPLNPIIDFNTRFSGITKEQMDKTRTNILQIQANILHLCNSQTILVGHSLESDLKALKIVHSTVIDTSVLFPHKMGLPHKRALKALASEYIKKIIQNDVGGHDSAEDAITCMELLKWKLKEHLKTN
ncbi:unnamed protein product [Brassicogethes aeneus]|uniref:Exonuclease domain-containing protein n=1 Tax=Brassicogethes aeneus TaxID=1431903 RepID=A0A9P0ARE1_BRAAE|nr:unnamed protein product [Brassicogethes aeneus]